MLDPGWASRFYGMEVSPEIAAAVHERLTDPTIPDLVDAHLAINYSYFGAIDKTLAGFVVLSDAGDDFTLLDLRDGGQIWWQDHRTRQLELHEDSLAELGSDQRAPAPKTNRLVATPALCHRYQWLVWLLARPLEKHGVSLQTTDYLARAGIGRFRGIWPDRSKHDAAFEAELPELRRDPHLAIYWLLHTTMLGDDARRVRVLSAIGVFGSELARVFASRFGMLTVRGDIPIVPDFRARRALALTYGAFELAPDEVPSACLRALEVSPATYSLLGGLQISGALDRGTLDVDSVTQVVARIPDATPGVEHLRAVLDKRKGATASAHADALARSIAAGSPEPWWHALEALWQVHELAYDGPALVAATRRLVAHDRYHRRGLQMAMRAAQIAGEPVELIEADIVVADGIAKPYARICDKPEDWELAIDGLEDRLALGLAWRVLQRAELNRPTASLAGWAAAKVLGSSEPGREALVGAAFGRLDAAAQRGMVGELAKLIDRADHPAVSIILACLEAPEPSGQEVAASVQLAQAKESAVIALAPWFHEQTLFDRVMATVERPEAGELAEVVWNKLFSPFDKTNYVVPRLGDFQALRVTRVLIGQVLRHPQIRTRNAAGHALFRFTHRGAETLLVDSLTEYGVRFAATKGPGGVQLDAGKTENDQLETLVASLYAAVSRLGTPAAKGALVERLFAERRSYWRMGSALGMIWDPAIHARVLGLLAERKDPRAAGCYAYALREFVKQVPPLVELTRAICEWQGETEGARSFLHYALVVGVEAALGAGDLELVRKAQEAAAWISEPPIEPDAFARGIAWKNPLEDPEVKARLERALAGPTVETAPAPEPAPTAKKRAPRAKPAAKKPEKPEKRPAKPKKAKATKPKAKKAKRVAPKKNTNSRKGSSKSR